MSLFQQMTPEQQMMLKQIYSRQNQIKQRQSSNQYIPHSGGLGVVASVVQEWADGRKLNEQEKKTAELLKQIKTDKKNKMTQLAQLLGWETPKETKQQQPVQGPVMSQAQTQPINTQVPAQMPIQKSAPVSPGFNADKLMAAAIQSGDENLFKTAMTMKMKSQTGGQDAISKQIRNFEAMTGRKMSPDQIAKIYQDQWTGAARRGQTNVNIDLNKGTVSPDKTTMTQLQKKIVDSQGTLDRLSVIQSQYDPNYSTYSNQLKMWGSAKYEKLGGTLEPKNKAMLDRYTSWRALAFDHLNQYIKDISGAAVSVEEAKRLMKAQPNPQTDSPTQFKSKLDAQMLAMRMIKARAQYMVKNNISLKEAEGIMPVISTNNPTYYIKKYVKEKGLNYYNSLKKTVSDDNQRREMTRKYLQDNFGLAQ